MGILKKLTEIILTLVVGTCFVSLVEALMKNKQHQIHPTIYFDFCFNSCSKLKTWVYNLNIWFIIICNWYLRIQLFSLNVDLMIIVFNLLYSYPLGCQCVIHLFIYSINIYYYYSVFIWNKSLWKINFHILVLLPMNVDANIRYHV